MFDARRRNLRGDHRETGPAAGEGLDVLRVKHGFRLDFVFRGNQIQGLDLADINAQVANRHPFGNFTGIKGMQRNLATDCPGSGFRSIENAFVANSRTGAAAAEIVKADCAFQCP